MPDPSASCCLGPALQTSEQKSHSMQESLAAVDNTDNSGAQKQRQFVDLDSFRN